MKPLLLLLFLASCKAPERVQTQIAVNTTTSAPKVYQRGLASIYTDSRTASGEKFRSSSLCAAHKTLPFGSRVRVSYNKKSVIVRINDRGPYVKGRIIDLTPAAARAIGLSLKQGIAKVELSIVN